MSFDYLTMLWFVKKTSFFINMPKKIHACTLTLVVNEKPPVCSSVWVHVIRKYLHLEMFYYITLFEQIVIIST